ncbi:MAG: relaxase/mobilization nuclease domain-containing protein [Bacteroidota bacterium]
MIIKILGASNTFSGIHYNENKNELGRSELLAAENFEGLDTNTATRDDYIAYMTAVGNLNSRVKNKQFHAVLSAKGRELSPEQLMEFAKTYLKEMGYGKNPYLIYTHNDTKNNHVHIVSPRVDMDGRHINNKYERVRSQKILKEKFSYDFGRNLEKDKLRIEGYGISTVQQYKLLWEQLGYKTSQKQDSLNIVSSGRTLLKVPLDSIRLEEGSQQKKQRAKQLYPIFLKLSNGLSRDAFSELVHKKMGVELIFHTAKGHEKPYGYSILDHKAQFVYKGSEVFPLKGILNAPDRQPKIEVVKEVVNFLLKESNTIQEFKRGLNGYGYYLGQNHSIFLDDTQQRIFDLTRQEIRTLYQKNNTAIAQGTTFYGKESMKALTSFLRIPNLEMKPDKISKATAAYYKNEVKLLLQTSHLSKDSLHEKGYLVFEAKGHQFFWDKEQKFLINLDVDLGGIGRFPDHVVYKVSNQKHELAKAGNLEMVPRLMQELLWLPKEEDEEMDDRKRNKKKRFRNKR